MRTIFSAWLGNVLLWAIVSQLNHYLAPFTISLFAGGLCVAFTALRLPVRDGVRVLLLTGAWFDAATPVPFGLHMLLFVFAHTLIVSFRERLARDDTLVGLLVAAVTNLGVILALSIGLLHRSPALWELGARVSVDSLASFCFLMLIGPWFFACQQRALRWAGVTLRRDQRTLS